MERLSNLSINLPLTGRAKFENTGTVEVIGLEMICSLEKFRRTTGASAIVEERNNGTFASHVLTLLTSVRCGWVGLVSVLLLSV